MPDVEQPQTKRSTSSRGCCGFMAFGFLLGVGTVIALFAGVLGYLPDTVSRHIGLGRGVAVLDIRGELLDERPILENLERLVENPDTRALVLRVDSPGGIVTVMEELFAAVRRAKVEQSLPVVASMGAVAASGGYYVCLAADRIYANRTSLTGSIGAALEHYNAQELLSRIGVEHETIVSGPFKSTGSWAETLTPQQRSLLHDVVNDIEASFVTVVEATRGMAPEQARAVADGRIVTGRQAIALGLVDEIGDLHDAVACAAAKAALGPDYRVIRMPRDVPIKFRWLDWLGSFGSGYSPLGLVPKYVLK